MRPRFNEIIQNPTTGKMFDAYTYGWWAGILTYRPIDDLIKYNGLVFMLHGTEDISSPVKSNMQILLQRDLEQNPSFPKGTDARSV